MTETKIFNRASPSKPLDRNKSDEVLDIAVGLIRVLQAYRRTRDRAILKQLRPHEDAMRLHFPSLSRGEIHRLANVLVHIGSMALRHALGMAVVVPGSEKGLEAPVKIGRDKHRRLLNVRLEDGTLVTLEDALERLFREHSRLTAAEAFEQMKDHGWVFLFKGKNPTGSIRERMRQSPLFRQVKRPGDRRVVAFKLA